MKHVPFIDSFKFAFDMMKKNTKLLLILLLIQGFFSFLYLELNRFGNANEMTKSSIGLVNLKIILSIALLILMSSMAILILRFALKGYDSSNRIVLYEEIKFISINSMFSFVGRYILIALAFFFFIFLGFIILLFPGIILCLTYSFAQLILIEHNMPAKKVFRISEHLTNGIKWKLFGYFLFILLLLIPSFLFGFYYPKTPILWRNFILTLYSSLIYVPIANLSLTYIYKDIERQQLILDSPNVTYDKAEENDLP